ncbi:hypothetical protein CASFOL_014192 [Castilleja foliolosa]|uniref:Uncharacterized protein n=1 Tax=Castilleja foliolosa TaxID=1961234 RepID=A0ABD3DMS7_9LAMI
MDPEPDKTEDPPSNSTNPISPFPDEVLEKVLSFVDSHKDRNSISLVRKDWYNAERWTRSKLFIGNCYSVSPEIAARRFPRIKSITLKGKPRFSDFNLLPQDWGANVHSWLVVFAKVYPFLEELRLKRMTVTDESLELLAKSFPSFKALSLWTCEGFSENGLKAVASHCRNLTELDIQDSVTNDINGDWLSCFPENFASLEILNFASLNTEASFDALERLVSQCKLLRVLKVNETISLDQLQRLLLHASQLTELGTGSFVQELTPHQYQEIESTISSCKNLRVVSGLWDLNPVNLPLLYGACPGLTFLDLTNAPLGSEEFVKLLAHCSNLRRLWVVDTVGDKGLNVIGSSCPFLEELRVLPSDPYDQDHREGVSELGLLSISLACRKLHYILYFCRKMTNAAVISAVHNRPDFTHFRLCIMTPRQPDYLTNEPMDEAFSAVARACPNLKRLSVSGLLTDHTFESIGKYAKNLETLSVAFAGGSDWGMQCVLEGCRKLRKLEIRDCPFGNKALLAGLDKYETMRFLWMSACYVTVKGCRALARGMPRLNVEVIVDEDDESLADKIYVYRSVAGPRRDAPPFVIMP